MINIFYNAIALEKIICYYLYQDKQGNFSLLY